MSIPPSLFSLPLSPSLFLPSLLSTGPVIIIYTKMYTGIAYVYTLSLSLSLSLPLSPHRIPSRVALWLGASCFIVYIIIISHVLCLAPTISCATAATAAAAAAAAAVAAAAAACCGGWATAILVNYRYPSHTYTIHSTAVCCSRWVAFQRVFLLNFLIKIRYPIHR